MTVLKNNIRYARKSKGWSQTRLADEIKVSQNTISSIETGQYCPSALTAALLCKALDCKFEELFYLCIDDSDH